MPGAQPLEEKRADFDALSYEVSSLKFVRSGCAACPRCSSKVLNQDAIRERVFPSETGNAAFSN